MLARRLRMVLRMPRIRTVTGRVRCFPQRIVTAAIAAAAAGCAATALGCGDAGDAGPADAAAAAPDAGAPHADAAPADATGADAGADACPAGPAGLDCLFAQWDDVTHACGAGRVAALRASLEARRGALPVWHAGRALFASFGRAVAVAGEFNDWDATALATSRVCDTDLFAVEAAIPSGRYEYKLVVDGTWRLDPENWAFAYDDFDGNPDRRNSVLNTYDSGVGHLVQPPTPVCSDALGNCRALTAYLPAGYGDPANADRRYPALFMHDGQNVFDDATCCFGFGGWNVNVTLDDEIAAGRVAPVIVVGADNGLGQRNDEYGWPEAEGGLRATFMQFQVEVVQPTAAQYWRIDANRVYTAGSSLGGNIALHLAFAYPDVYAGAASLSGALWPGEDTGASAFDALAAAGKVPVALYLDHGGDATSGGDNYAINVQMRDQLVAAGWRLATSPDCGPPNDDALCYFHDVGAAHNELAWRARSWRFLRFLFPPAP